MSDPAWARFQPHYAAICREFGFDERADAAAARALRAMLGPLDAWPRVMDRLAVRGACVVGCAAALDDLPAGALGPTTVACDGATARMRELGRRPDVVVTDLDGHPDGLLWAARQGSAFVVHAHGDNGPALHALVPRLLATGAPVVGTFQGQPEAALEPMRNLGGFTDGDRAVLLCEAAGVQDVRLLAFDLAAKPSRHSHRFDARTKPAKLAWAGRLLDEVQRRGRLSLS